MFVGQIVFDQTPWSNYFHMYVIGCQVNMVSTTVRLVPVLWVNLKYFLCLKKKENEQRAFSFAGLLSKHLRFAVFTKICKKMRKNLELLNFELIEFYFFKVGRILSLLKKISAFWHHEISKGGQAKQCCQMTYTDRYEYLSSFSSFEFVKLIIRLIWGGPAPSSQTFISVLRTPGKWSWQEKLSEHSSNGFN